MVNIRYRPGGGPAAEPGTMGEREGMVRNDE